MKDIWYILYLCGHFKAVAATKVFSFNWTDLKHWGKTLDYKAFLSVCAPTSCTSHRFISDNNLLGWSTDDFQKKVSIKFVWDLKFFQLFWSNTYWKQRNFVEAAKPTQIGQNRLTLEGKPLLNQSSLKSSNIKCIMLRNMKKHLWKCGFTHHKGEPPRNKTSCTQTLFIQHSWMKGASEYLNVSHSALLTAPTLPLQNSWESSSWKALDVQRAPCNTMCPYVHAYLKNML